MSATIILPYTPERTTARDIEWIGRCLERRDRKVRLLAYDDALTPVALAEPLGARTVTVTLNNNSPSPIFEFLPGPKFFARRRSKAGLVADLAATGALMPHSEAFTLETVPDEARFGPYMAIKTTAPGTTRAKGIHVFKTRDFADLRARLLALYRAEMAAGFAPVLQQYIPTGPKPKHTRVSTFLGAPIVCFHTIAPAPFDPAALTGLAGGEATSNYSAERTRVLADDAEMVEMAKTVCAGFPETSVISLDMVRCVETGRVYCIEVNLGNLCVLSAPICGGLRRDLGAEAVLKQFGSYDTIARRMIEELDRAAPA
ncbi:hypothetical protein [Marivita sp. GX14005]|uniref:hypothetical protein n=1 Tax=Marivita sp. GX14005 TaxID=2942276 RepID=UPI0020190B92|nr:hypothetical protein [Marivita sp. GX14005]MCL3883943.1 hypothetical protein [Marivita sp. GX14005]